MGRIQDNNFFYWALLHYMAIFHDSAYRKIEYVGIEKIPTDSAIIYAPNHSSALMDALVVLMMKRKPTVFVARGDLFKNKKINKILRFLKILPIARRRDGLGEVKKNNITMQESVSALCNGLPFGIMPEGGQQTKRSLMPLGKGIFRIALDANDIIGSKRPIYIVPMGINFASYFEYRNTLFVEVGEPINITKFVEEHIELDRPEQMNLLRKILRDSILPYISYLYNDEFYNGSYDLVLLANKQIIKDSTSRKSNLYKRTKASRSFSNLISSFRNKISDTSIFNEANEFYNLRMKLGVIDDTLLKGTSLFKRLIMSLLIVTLFPYFIFAAIISAPIHGIVKYINKLLNDKEFNNTVRFAANLIFYPLILFIWFIVALCVFSKLQIAIYFIIASFPSYYFSHDYCYLIRRLKSDIIFAHNNKLNKKLISLRAHIQTIISN